MKRYFLLIIHGDVEPELAGPFVTEAARDQAAKEHRANDPDRDDGLFPLDIVSESDDFEVEVDAYSGGFFIDEEEED